MKIFISWSGQRSHEVAKLLSSWIRCVIQATEPWLSSEDIDRGSLWNNEINDQLKETSNGIICLTKSNINNPWILFEAGSLSKGLSSARIFTFLIDIDTLQIDPPLSQFNHTKPISTDLFKLVKSINSRLERKVDPEILNQVFDLQYPIFEEKFNKILENTSDEGKIEIKKDKEEILIQILSSVRGMDRRLRYIEASKEFSSVDAENATEVAHMDIDLKNMPLKEINMRIKEYRSMGLNSSNILRKLNGVAPKPVLISLINKIDNEYT